MPTHDSQQLFKLSIIPCRKVSPFITLSSPRLITYATNIATANLNVAAANLSTLRAVVRLLVTIPESPQPKPSYKSPATAATKATARTTVTKRAGRRSRRFCPSIKTMNRTNYNSGPTTGNKGPRSCTPIHRARACNVHSSCDRSTNDKIVHKEPGCPFSFPCYFCAPVSLLFHFSSK